MCSGKPIFGSSNIDPAKDLAEMKTAQKSLMKDSLK